MRRAPQMLLVLLLPLLVGSESAVAAKSADARRGLHDLFQPLRARRGVAQRSLAAVPLVSVAPSPKAEAAVDSKGVAWRPVQRAGAKGVVALDRAASKKVAEDKSADPGPGVIWPSGMVLRRGPRERLTQRPLLIPPPSAQVGTVPVERQIAVKHPDAEVERSVHGTAPISFRHTVFATRSGDALTALLGVAASVVGLEPRKTSVGLTDVAAHPDIAKQLDAARKALRPLRTAYAGEVSGHVLFLGNRPVEVVAFPSPKTYQSYVRVAAPGLALSLVIWEGVYGRTGPDVEKPDWDALQAETEKIVRALGRATVVRASKREQSERTGELWRVRATLPRARAVGDIGWLLSDPKGRALLVELFPNGTAGPLPAPAPKPGAPPINQDPYNRKSGAMTKWYIERFLEQFRLRRRAHLR